MSYGFNGSIIRIAKPCVPFVANSMDMPPTHIEYDEYYYNINTMCYTKIENPHEIEKLKKELAQKKKEKQDKLKNIIGYYYKR